MMMFANEREPAALPMALSDHMPPRCTTRTATDNPPHRETTGGRTAEGRMRPSKHNDTSPISTTTQGCMHTHNDVRTQGGNMRPYRWPCPTICCQNARRKRTQTLHHTVRPQEAGQQKAVYDRPSIITHTPAEGLTQPSMHNDICTREGNGIPIGRSARRLWRQEWR